METNIMQTITYCSDILAHTLITVMFYYHKSTMSCEEDLYKVITEELRTSGHLSRLQGEVRSKVLELLGRHWGVSISPKVPEPPSQISLLNQAIKEYLEWMGYTHSSSLFSAESGTAEDASKFISLKTDFGLQRNDGSQDDLPVLLNVFTAIINP